MSSGGRSPRGSAGQRVLVRLGPSVRWRRGEKAVHAVAYARGEDVIVIAARLIIGLDGDWGEAVLDIPPGRWRNEFIGDVIGGGVVPLADLLCRFPVALLAREEEG